MSPVLLFPSWTFSGCWFKHISWEKCLSWLFENWLLVNLGTTFYVEFGAVTAHFNLFLKPQELPQDLFCPSYGRTPLQMSTKLSQFSSCPWHLLSWSVYIPLIFQILFPVRWKTLSPFAGFGFAAVVLMNLFSWECFLINAAMLRRNAGGIMDNKADENGGTSRSGSPLLWRQAES